MQLGAASAAAPAGILVPTTVTFLQDGDYFGNALDFLNALLHEPQRVLPPVKYGLVKASDAGVDTAMVDPSVFVGGDRPASHAPAGGLPQNMHRCGADGNQRSRR